MNAQLLPVVMGQAQTDAAVVVGWVVAWVLVGALGYLGVVLDRRNRGDR